LEEKIEYPSQREREEATLEERERELARIKETPTDLLVV